MGAYLRMAASGDDATTNSKSMEIVWRKTAPRWSKESNVVQKYKVTLILTAEEFVDLIQQRLGPTNHLKVEKHRSRADRHGGMLDPSAMSRARTR